MVQNIVFCWPARSQSEHSDWVGVDLLSSDFFPVLVATANLYLSKDAT